MQKGYFYEDFFEDKRDVLFFNNAEDLRDYIIYYSKNFKERSLIASNGKKKYFELFENQIVANYIIEKILDQNISKKLKWMI